MLYQIVQADHHQNFKFFFNFKKLFRNTFFPPFFKFKYKSPFLFLYLSLFSPSSQTDLRPFPKCRSIPQHLIPLLPLFSMLVIAFSLPKSNFIANSFFLFLRGPKGFCRFTFFRPNPRCIGPQTSESGTMNLQRVGQRTRLQCMDNCHHGVPLGPSLPERIGHRQDLRSFFWYLVCWGGGGSPPTALPSRCQEWL